MAANTNSVLTINSSSTNITTGAYVQLIAATLVGCFKILMSNGTSEIIKLAVGASGSEVDLIAVASGQSVVVDFHSINTIPVGSRVALKAVDNNASSGWVTVSLIQ